MQDLIEKTLKDLLNRLLKQALTEKPEVVTRYCIYYPYLQIDRKKDIINIWSGWHEDIHPRWFRYSLKYTNDQKEIIKQIFVKWR